MDDLQLLRETRNDVGTVPAAVLARGRDRLMKLAEAETDTASGGRLPVLSVSALPVRRPWRRVLLATAAAAAIAATIVVADVVGPGERPGATAEAAEVLNDAASTSITTADPVVGPGQYLKIETTAVYAAGVLLGEGPAESRRTVEWLEQHSDQLYIPADKSGDWIWSRQAGVPTTFFGDEDKAEAAKYQESQRGETGSTAELLRGPGGNFYGVERFLFADVPLAEGIKTLPRDPQALLDVIRQRGKPNRPEAETLEAIAAALGTGAVPADLRAALYKAAALIPGVTVVDRQANLNGRTGTAIGIEHPNRGTRMDILIDPATGLLIGERVVMLSDGETFPAGTATAWTSISTSVVDRAP